MKSSVAKDVLIEPKLGVADTLEGLTEWYEELKSKGMTNFAKSKNLQEPIKPRRDSLYHHQI